MSKPKGKSANCIGKESSMCKERMVFTNGSLIKVDPYGELVPCLFFVETEHVPQGIKYSFSGKVNPFPFKEIIVTKFCRGYSIKEWIEDNGWLMISKETIG